MPAIKEYNSLYNLIDDKNFFVDMYLHSVAKKLDAIDDLSHPMQLHTNNMQTNCTVI
jgi:hypothetical protein